jgi:hypothetical protein
MAQRRRSFAFDAAEDAALLAGDEDAARIGRVVASTALVDIGALDCPSGELLGGVDDTAERMSVVGISRQNLGVKHELAAGSASIGGDDRSLDTKLVGCAGLALADAFDLGRVVSTRAGVLRGSDLLDACQLIRR